MTLWFTSDLHLGHARVIEYSKRPYANVEEMDESLIRNWNDQVDDGDTVYVVGDFSFHRPEYTAYVLARLRGSLVLVKGNHDRKIPKGFSSVHDMLTVKVPDPDASARMGHVQRIVLCHYAMRVWDKSHYGAWHLYGHSHGSLPDNPHSLSFDIGVDCWGYAPVNYETVKAKMQSKEWRPVDHHGQRDEH